MKRITILLAAMAFILMSFAQTTQENETSAVIDSIGQTAEKGTMDILTEAYYYERGIDRERNLFKAFELFKEASDTSECAKFRVAAYYFNGWGIPKDKKLAKEIMKSLKESEEYGKAAKSCIKRMRRGARMGFYEFQFRWLPSHIKRYLSHKPTHQLLSDITNQQIELGLNCIVRQAWDWTQISADVLHPTDSTEIVLYHFPYPENPPLCLFAAAYINHQAHTYGYYTLEKAIDNKHWMLCSVADGYHLNFGVFEEHPSEMNFIKRITKLREESEMPIVVSRLR